MRRLALLLVLLAGPAGAQVVAPPGSGPGAEAPNLPPTATPVPGPGAAAARRAEIERLLDSLPAAPDEVSAAALEGRLRVLWSQGGSPAVALLMRRAVRQMEGRDAAGAVEDLDAAITLQPDFAEAWILRARAFSAAGEPRAAAADLAEALRLEPRHFGALLALSALQEGAGDLRGALNSLDAVLTLHPRLPGGFQKRQELRRRALGEDA